MLFEEKTINQYRKYFNFPDVIKLANDIKNAVESCKKLKTEEEFSASIILSCLLLKEKNNF